MNTKINFGLSKILIIAGLTAPLPIMGAGSIDVTDSGVGVSNTAPLYNFDVGGGGVSKSQMHFSLSGNDVGGWVSSLLDNNFWMSSGAVYNNDGWYQKSSDGQAVLAGSGSLGYRIFTSSGYAIGQKITPIVRFQINYAGEVGIGAPAQSGKLIATSTTAYLSTGGVWTDASSATLKKDIQNLTTEDALQTLANLRPVTFAYKADEAEKHVGFIAEEVPDLVATKDRMSLSPMDIAAVLTKAVQEKSRLIDKQQEMLETLAAKVARLEAELDIKLHMEEIAQK